MNASRLNLSEVETYRALTEGGLRVVSHMVVTSSNQAASAAEELGYPVVCKVVSPDILHKSRVGGVICNLYTPAAVREAFDQITSRIAQEQPSAKIEGCLICRQMPAGLSQVIVGTAADAEFGKVVMFGVGGEFAEIIRCVEFGMLPLSWEEASSLVCRTHERLRAIPGWAEMDLGIPTDLVYRFGKFLESHSKMESIDINPAIIYKEDYVVIDAKGTLAAD